MGYSSSPRFPRTKPAVVQLPRATGLAGSAAAPSAGDRPRRDGRVKSAHARGPQPHTRASLRDAYGTLTRPSGRAGRPGRGNGGGAGSGHCPRNRYGTDRDVPGIRITFVLVNGRLWQELAVPAQGPARERGCRDDVSRALVGPGHASRLDHGSAEPLSLGGRVATFRAPTQLAGCCSVLG